LAHSAHGKISRNFGEIPQDDNKIELVFAKSGKIAPDFLIFQSISRNFRSALSRSFHRLAMAVSGQCRSATVGRCFSDRVLSVVRDFQFLQKAEATLLRQSISMAADKQISGNCANNPCRNSCIQDN
jgi:hypothetical protein